MNRRMLTPRFAFAGAAMLLVLLVASVGYALATEPTFSTENTCVEGGEACTGDESCSENSFATACVSSKCEIPCEAQDDQGNTIQSLEACALGERCVADGTRFTCQPHAFRVDLNLLDLCIKHYLDKTSPVFTANECSLERNLNLLLDQNNDKEFDLFDVDLCVLAFLEQQGCKEDPSTSDQVYQDGALEDAACCKTDSDCDPGTYCDENLNICQRDCGFVASREVSVEPFELECFRALTTCDYSRGRCATIDVTELTCEVDSDCLPGSYCLLGTCTPNCYRSLDCPDSGW